jgi:hypothetical protein
VTDSPEKTGPSGPASPPAPAKPSSWRSNARFAADIVNTLAVPILTVAATAVGLYATNSLKEREIAIATENNAQALRNQREESETNLRTAMFRELVGPLLQGQAGAPTSGSQADLPRTERLALLAELLTLNFHEHFELGPLLQYVDSLPGQAEEARARLRSTARRVISRQLAPMLSASSDRAGQHPAFLELSLNSDVKQAADALQSCALAQGDSSPAVGAVTVNCSATAQGAPLRVTSPDGRDSLQVNIRAVNWAAQTVGIYALVLDARGGPRPNTPPIEFTLSPYSFPFSDNTLLPSGNRFGIYLTRLDVVPDVLRVMRLSFVWFPKNFVPPRERPFELDVGAAPKRAANPVISPGSKTS